MRKRITSLLLTLVMLLSLVPAMGVTASAAEPEWTTVNTYKELQDAVKGQKEYIKLGQNIDTTNYNEGIGLLKRDTLTFKYTGYHCTLDLNGKTLALVSKDADMYSGIHVSLDSHLTIQDSSSAKTGKMSGTFDNVLGGREAILIYATDSTLTLEGGTFTVTSKPYKENATVIDSERSFVTIKDGVTISQPEFIDEGYARDLDGVGYALLTTGKSKTIIEGGTFDGSVKLTGYQDTNGSVQINGGTFKSVVQLMYAATENNPNPAVIVNDGTFEGNVYLQGWPWRTSLYMPHRLNGGTIYGSLDLCADDFITDKDKPEGNLNIALGLDKCFGYNAVSKHDGVFTGSNIHNAIDWKTIKQEYRTDYYMVLKGDKKNPIRIIPNAWGMKSVTLDGNPIDYFKDWKGTVERMDNSTAHTLKFEWNPLASELVNAGYSYNATCDRYISGSTTPTTDTISATDTEYSFTIDKDAPAKVYSFALHLNLKKTGSPYNVGIYSNEHIVKLVVNPAPPVLDTFISTVSFRLAKTVVGEPGELSFTATDVNGNPVAINPDVTWDPTNIQEGPNNHVSFTIHAPKGYTFSDKDGKTTALKFGGVDVIGYVDNTGALNFSFPLDVPHQHKVDHVGYNARFHWDVCSCGQQIMNTGAPHTMGDWVAGDTLSGGGVEYTRSCTRAGCGYTETTISYENVKHVTSLVLNMENYPMDGMKPHNFVKNGSETPKDSDGEYLLTERDDSILYPSFSITSGGDKAKLYAMNPESYTVRADNPDFAKWSSRGSLLAPECDDAGHDTHSDKSTFTTGVKYGVRLFLEAENGYAFYKDFNEASNFKLFTDMNGIEVETYRVEAWYYKNIEGVDDWNRNAPADDSAGASKVRVLFQLTAKNEGDLNITLPELKAGDDLKATWAGFDGTPNFGTGNFVDSCYAKNSKTMQWTGGPSCVILNNSVTGESVIAQAGQTYTLTIPAVNENVLAHITIKNPEAATKVIENEDGTITVTYELPAAADDKTVNGAAVSITPPAYGAASSTTATVAGTDHCTASAVTWNPADAAFEAKEYTATVTLTANDGYTFAIDAVFTINGYMATVTKNADGSVTLRYTFPALTGPHTHTYGGNWVFATPDTHIRYCTANDLSYEEAPHSITSWTANPDGKTHTGTCTDCHYAKTENHSWEVVGEVPPTVDMEGSRSYKCSACAATKNESIPKLIEYSVTAKGDGNGTASASPAKAVAGTEITLSAKADSGYHFKEWQVVKGGMTITNNKFTMPAENVEVKAIFEKNASTGGGGGGGVTTYAITVKSAKNGDVTASHKTASKGTTVTLTVDPDKGYVLDTLTVLDGKDKEIKLTEKNGKYTFTMPASKVTVAATFKASAPTGKNPFIDVPAGSYYEDAVVWAVEKGITSGTSAVTFDPNGNCTRAQAVTFLWRAAGSPAPKTKVMPFTDVPSGSYYYDAVLWAMEQGITKGTSDTAFSPNASCTRAQIVTFLWRANGSPVVSGNSAFTDVASDAYYAAAVAWAEKNDVTGGIGNGLFGSNNNCTRAQIVTFLYRAMK